MLESKLRALETENKHLKTLHSGGLSSLQAKLLVIETENKHLKVVHSMDKLGWIYAISTSCFDGLVKIGCTSGDDTHAETCKKLRSRYGTYYPNVQIISLERVSDHRSAEKDIKSSLAGKKCSGEIYKASTHEIECIMIRIAKMYKITP